MTVCLEVEQVTPKGNGSFAGEMWRVGSVCHSNGLPKMVPLEGNEFWIWSISSKKTEEI